MTKSAGINNINNQYLPDFINCLDRCKDMDYHKKAVELAIERGIKFSPLNIGDSTYIVIDFEEDLEKAKKVWKQTNNE